jgi:sugar/nucleoside kinase (ribokinase family)
MLYGLHEGWTSVDAAKLGSCCAAASLSHPGASEGILPLAETMKLEARFGLRPAPINV